MRDSVLLGLIAALLLGCGDGQEGTPFYVPGRDGGASDDGGNGGRGGRGGTAGRGGRGSAGAGGDSSAGAGGDSGAGGLDGSVEGGNGDGGSGDGGFEPPEPLPRAYEDTFLGGYASHYALTTESIGAVAVLEGGPFRCGAPTASFVVEPEGTLAFFASDKLWRFVPDWGGARWPESFIPWGWSDTNTRLEGRDPRDNDIPIATPCTMRVRSVVYAPTGEPAYRCEEDPCEQGSGSCVYRTQAGAEEVHSNLVLVKGYEGVNVVGDHNRFALETAEGTTRTVGLEAQAWRAHPDGFRLVVKGPEGWARYFLSHRGELLHEGFFQDATMIISGSEVVLDRDGRLLDASNAGVHAYSLDAPPTLVRARTEDVNVLTLSTGLHSSVVTGAVPAASKLTGSDDPVSVMAGVLDPKEAYVVAPQDGCPTLVSHGADFEVGLPALPRTSNARLTWDHGIIRPTDGVLFMLANGGIKTYVPQPLLGTTPGDLCPGTAASTVTEVESLCPYENGAAGVGRMWLRPDTGLLVYECDETRNYFDENDQVLTFPHRPLHLGYGNTALLYDEKKYQPVILNESGELVPLEIFPPRLYESDVDPLEYSARAYPDRFELAYDEYRFTIYLDGQVELHTIYPHESVTFPCVIEDSGSMLCVSNTIPKVIYRSVQGALTVDKLYEEGDVTLASFEKPVIMVTGP